MIIRILNEGQFDVDDAYLARLNELDAALEQAVEAGADEKWVGFGFGSGVFKTAIEIGIAVDVGLRAAREREAG